MGEHISKETPTAFAKRIGMSKSYITKLKADDRLVTEPKGKRWLVLVEASLAKIAASKDANRDDVVTRHAENRETEKEDVPVSPAEDKAQLSYQQSRAKNEHFKALAQQADYEKQIGDLVEMDQVKLGGMDIGTQVRTALENLPDQLTPLLAPESDPDRVYAILVEAFEQVLTDMADSLKKAVEVRP